jgi:hypothetical protein
VVNYALANQTGSSHFGRGSRCPSGEFKPDWSVVSDSRLDAYGYYANVLAGDTKLSAKWRPEMVKSRKDRDKEEWKKVMSQILTYMASHHSRYGFIITDKALVALRLTRKPLHSGIAAQRSRRPPAPVHERVPSDTSMASAESSYVDNNPLQWAYYQPEYVIVDWAAHGKGQLTVKLTLWCLAMMATNGDNSIDYQYPRLNSWRLGAGFYVHNTSGATKPQLSENDTYQEPTDGEPPAEEGEEEGESDIAGSSYANYPSSSTSSYYYSAVAGPSTGATHYDADPAHFSQTNTPYYGGEEEEVAEEIVVAGDEYGARGYGGDEEENVGDTEGDEEEDEDEDDDDDDNQTEVGPSVKRIKVVIQKHTFRRGLYFIDPKGTERRTTKDKWQKVDGGYELRTRRHIYFTKRFP